MAKLYGNIASSALMTFDKSFARANGQPLDSTEIYYSLAAAEEYAAGAGAYVGQKIAVVENGVVTHYSIEDANGTLKELGVKPIGDTKTVKVAEDGKISLANIPETQKDEEGNDIPATYNAVLVNGVLTWVKPSATTVEGLSDLIEALTGRVDTAEADIEKLEAAVGVAAKPETSEGAGDAVEATGLFKALDDEIARATAAESALDGRITTLEEKEDKDTTYSVKEGEKVLSLDGTAFGTTLSIKYTGNKIQLCGIGEEVISEFDASAFVEDGVLEDASYDAEKKEITFTWNIVTGTDENGQPIYKTDVVAIGDLVDTYTAGNGLSLVNNEFSVVVPTDDKYLTVDATGVHTKGIDSAIEGAINPVAETLRTSISGVQSYAEGVADRVTTLEGKADGVDEELEVIGGSMSNMTEEINGLKEALQTHSNTAEQTYATKAYIGEFTTGEDDYKDLGTVVAYINKKAEETLSAAQGGSSETAASVALALQNYKNENDPKVKANTEAIAEIRPIAEQGVSDAAKAQAKADQVGTDLDAAELEITGLKSTTSDHTGRIVALETYKTEHEVLYSALKSQSDNHGTRIAAIESTYAKQADLETVSGKVTANEEYINTLKNTTLPGINEAIGKKADATALESYYTKSDIDAKTGDLGGKTIVTLINEAKTAATYDDTGVKALITAEEQRATAAEQANTKAISDLRSEIGNITNVMNFKGVAEALPELSGEHGYELGDVIIVDGQEYVVALDGETLTWFAFGAADAETAQIEILSKRIDNNEAAVTVTLPAAINAAEADANKYTDDAIAAIVIATSTKAGLVLASTAENAINVDATGVMTVNSLNVNKLVQTEGEELILNGGNA